MADNPFRKKDPRPSRMMMAQEDAMIRDMVTGALVQQIMMRDHGLEIAEWTKKALEEASANLAGLADDEFRYLLEKIQRDPMHFSILEELNVIHKDVKSDA